MAGTPKSVIMMEHDGKIATAPNLLRLISHLSEEHNHDESWKKMQNIRVILRLRPSNAVEQQYCTRSGIEDVPPKIIGNTVTMTQMHEKTTSSGGKSSKSKKFESTLDHILDPSTQQYQVFKVAGQSLLEAALGGFNATLFAYGQTGSGKTYSTFGANDDGSGNDMNAMGIIPRSFVYLFERLQQKCSNAIITEYFISMQLLQIYNKQLLDLLNPGSGKKLQIKTDFNNNNTVYVQGLTTINIASAREALAVIVAGSKNRKVASHNLNAHSSRSHMLVLLKLKQIGVDGSCTNSHINFGDLAGSESISKAHGKSDRGKDEDSKRAADERIKEGININASLSALTRCIFSLVKGKHPGYRDSPLTYLLKDSLGGNSKTTLLVCASPHIYNRSETVSTLRFARTAKDVKNKAKINQTLSVKALMKRIKELERENASLKKRINKKGGRKGKGKNNEPFMSALGKRMSLMVSREELDDEKKETVTMNMKYEKKGKKKKMMKKKKKKRRGNGGINGEDTGNGDYESVEDEDENEENDTEESNKWCWSYIFYCGGDDDEEIEDDVNNE